jgi:hypothetical protein
MGRPGYFHNASSIVNIGLRAVLLKGTAFRPYEIKGMNSALAAEGAKNQTPVQAAGGDYKMGYLIP